MKTFLKCSVCSLVFLNPEHYLTRNEEKKRYDLHQNSPEDQNYIHFLDQLLQPLQKSLKEGMQGLDFGCGPGPTISVVMDKRGFKMNNYDPFYFPNEEVLKSPYDFITCTEVLEHIHGPHEALSRFDQLLKPGGYIGILTSWIPKDKDFEKWHYPIDPTHVCFYSPEIFRWIADRMNWSVEFPSMNVAIFKKA